MPIDYAKMAQKYSAMDTPIPPTASVAPVTSQKSGVFSSLADTGTSHPAKSVWKQAADAVDMAYEDYKNMPGVKQIGQAVGAAVGSAGRLVGTAVGVAMSPVERAASLYKNIKNDGFGSGLKKTIQETPSAL